MIELYPCKRCGGERFEVVVKKQHELVIDREEDGKAFIDAGGDTVGDMTCSTCGLLAANPEALTQGEISYLLDGTKDAKART